LGGNKLILDGADGTLGFLQAQTDVPGLHLLQSTTDGQYSMRPGFRACICKLDRDEHPHSLLAFGTRDDLSAGTPADGPTCASGNNPGFF
jgi:hypothetical protein